MIISEFLSEIETMIEAAPGSIALDDDLASLSGWDSMAIISFIAMADEKNNVAVDALALAACKTVSDLAVLAGISKVDEG